MKLINGVSVRGRKIRLETIGAVGRRQGDGSSGRRRRGASPTRLRAAPAAALSIYVLYVL